MLFAGAPAPAIAPAPAPAPPPPLATSKSAPPRESVRSGVLPARRSRPTVSSAGASSVGRVEGPTERGSTEEEEGGAEGG